MRFVISLGLVLALGAAAVAQPLGPLSPDRAADLARIQANIVRLGLP